MSKRHLYHLGIHNFLLKVYKFTVAAYPLEFKFITMESEIHAHSTFLGCLWTKSSFPFFNLIFPVAHVAGQLTAPPPTCPGDTFTFRCTVIGDRNGITIWRVGGNSECLLTHNTAGTTSTCGPGRVFTARIETGFGLSFTSTLSGTASPTLNGTLIECFGPALSRDAENRVGGSILQISGHFVLFLVT